MSYPPRPTRQPYKCVCGKILYTPEVYYEHIKTCAAYQKWLKEKDEEPIRRLVSEVVKLCGEMCRAADCGEWKRYNELKAKRHDLLKEAVRLEEERRRLRQNEV